MNNSVTEYIISEKEITRRIRAFATLIISLSLAFTATGILFWYEKLGFWGACLVIMAPVLIVLRSYFVKFFKFFLETKIKLSDLLLERITPKTKETLLLKDIKKLTIIKTLRGSIREIRIFHGDKNLVLDGLDNFEQFTEELIEKCGKKVPLVKINEPIDYDHPYFYGILGSLLGIISIAFVKILFKAGTDQLRIVRFAVFIYVFAIGLYFILGKPISKRYGGKSILQDYIWGIMLLAGAFVVLLIGK